MEKPMFTDEQRAYFRAANARRQRSARPCVVCDKMIPAALSWQLYCSPACKQKAVRQRRRVQPADG
jgi:hypothetical protein